MSSSNCIIIENCRYGLSQAGMMLGPVVDDGIKLLGKIFGDNNLNANISNVKSPNPFVVFCRNHIDQDPIGDSLPGFSTKFCNEFFPAPTHTGICITKNLDIKEILHLEEEYNGFFEVEKQSSKLSVGKDNYWAQTTVVINALKMDPSKVMCYTFEIFILYIYYR